MKTIIKDSNGRVTIPKEIREQLGLKPGDAFACRITGDREVVLRRKPLDVSDLVGILHVPGNRATIRDMSNAVKDGALNE